MSHFAHLQFDDVSGGRVRGRFVSITAAAVALDDD